MEKKIIVLAYESEIPQAIACQQKYRLTYVQDLTSAIAIVSLNRLHAIFVVTDKCLSDIKSLKQHFHTAHLPVILFFKNKAILEKAVEAGIDDFLPIDCSRQKLLLRTSMNISKAKRDIEKNPLTKLPGNNEIEKIFLARKNGTCLHLDINSFKKYNDREGFLEGDRVIKETAKMLKALLTSESLCKNFLGHIGGDDFFIHTESEQPEKLCENIKQEFCEMIPELTISVAKVHPAPTRSSRRAHHSSKSNGCE